MPLEIFKNGICNLEINDKVYEFDSYIVTWTAKEPHVVVEYCNGYAFINIEKKTIKIFRKAGNDCQLSHKEQIIIYHNDYIFICQWDGTPVEFYKSPYNFSHSSIYVTDKYIVHRHHSSSSSFSIFVRELEEDLSKYVDVTHSYRFQYDAYGKKKTTLEAENSYELFINDDNIINSVCEDICMTGEYNGLGVFKYR